MTIRTLHLINGLGTGGAERSLAELLPDLPAHGIHPEVAVFHRRGEGVEDDVRAAGIPVHHVAATGWFNRIREVRTLVRRLEPDLVHTTIFEADVVGRVAAWREGVPVLTSLVNTSYDAVRLGDPNVTRFRLRGAQALDALTARLGTVRFHAITHVVSGAAVRALRLPPEHVAVVHRGRRRSRLGDPGVARRAAVRTRLGVPEDAIVVLHVGRQEHQKGHDVLLEAIAPLLSRRPHVHLVLAGRQGNASPAVSQRLSKLPHDRVHALGHVDDVPDLLAAADLFVFPSRYEGLGGSALEAMAMEIPIVASDLPALREFLDEVACFAPPGDAVALRGAIDSDLTDLPGARDRARLGRRRFDERFEHTSITDQMASLFAEIADTEN